MRYVYTIKIYIKTNPDRIDEIARRDRQINVLPIYRTFTDLQLPFKMNHFPTLFLYSHLALRHLVNTKLHVSQTIEMARSDAAVQKASKENIVKKVNSLVWC